MDHVYVLNLFIGREQVVRLMGFMAKSQDSSCYDFLFGALNHKLAEKEGGPLNPEHLMGADNPIIVNIPAEGCIERGRNVVLTFFGDNIKKIAQLAPDGQYSKFEVENLTRAMDDYIDFLKRRPGALHRPAAPTAMPKSN